MKSLRGRPVLLALSTMACLAAPPAFAESDDAGIRAVQTLDVQAKHEDGKASSGTPFSSSVTSEASAVPVEKAKPSSPRTKTTAGTEGSESLRAIVRRHAEANGVPFAIADAVVRVESRYNPRASNRGNYGLMQIRLQTARGIGYSGDASGLLNAETNARYGTKYLAQAYRMAGGDTCRTIMKYQSGHMATSMSGANRAYCSKVRTITARG